jgi:hypothetical protein
MRKSPVYSLAKASDLADTFYAGVAGGVVEVAVGRAAPPRGGTRPPPGREEAAEACGGWSPEPTLVAVLESGLGAYSGAGDNFHMTRIIPQLRGQLSTWPNHRAPKSNRLDHRLYSQRECMSLGKTTA